MTESELYKELGILTDDKDRWEDSIPYVASLLDHESVKIQAKALWLLGEMGLAYPLSAQDAVPTIASFLDRTEPLLRERAVNALGRIGRGDYTVIESCWTELFRFASDEESKVRLSFIWASENIATNTPDIYENHMPVFEKLLHDTDDRVRMEAPEIFRVLGKRRPEFIRPYVEQLKQSIADSIASKKLQCNALQDFADAEVMLNGQDTVYKKLYQQAFELSLIQKMTPQLEKLKAREQALFAQLQGSYQKAQAASQVVPFLQKRMPVLDNTFANIQMVSTKIQETAYKPFIQRIKDYLIGLACIAVLLLFFSMISAKLKQAKAARQQAKQYQEMMRRNGNGIGGYPTI